MTAPVLKKTPLNAFHIAQGAKMVGYSGWHMPVWYDKNGLLPEHKHCRQAALLFDVSHMKQFTFTGKDAIRFFESCTPADVTALPNAKGRLCFVPNERCGIIDDCIVHRRSETDLGLVVNAGCADKDEKHFRALVEERTKGAAAMDVQMVVHEDRSLLALQGPRAAEALSKFVDDLEKLDFMFQRHSVERRLTGSDSPLYITRCGYTGEDGFELAIRNEDTEAVAAKLLAALGSKPEDNGVRMGGLGCRDTLRLEAGMCLYGHEMTEDINPLEAGLMWEVTKRRREHIDTIPFVGADKFKELLAQKVPPRKRIGLTSTGGPCAREGADIKDKATGEVIGHVTSGSPSPSLPGKNVHQGYIKTPFAKNGTEVIMQVRNKQVPAVVAPMPFIETKYYRKPAGL